MDGDLRNMVMSFRVTELQTLLAYAGKNKTGRKNELQARALELVKSKSNPVVAKIKELYRSMQQSMAQPPGTGSSTISGSYNQNSSTNNSGIPHNQTRLYVGTSGYGGSAEKILQGISPFASYNSLNQQKSQPVVTMPICPDVKMKKLPFYDIVSELIKPTSLMPQGPGRVQEASYTFCLTPQQAADIAASKEYVHVSLGDQKLQFTMQIQLRFCALETSCDQEDQFPPSICVKVNAKLVPLPHPIPSNRPGVEPKRPSRPLNITNYVRLSPTITNTVTVTWASDNSSKGFAMSLYLVRKMTSSDLLNRLKQKGVRPADYSRGMIKELIAKDDGDCMIAMTSLKVSIACPLGKCRMSLPCRSTTCKHLQCFDANLFLQMNERKPTWACPVCDKPTLFENLCIDGYFQEVISKMSSSESMDVELLPDGSWQPMSFKIKKEKEEYAPPAAKRLKSDQSKLNQTIDLEDDIVIEDPPKPSTSKTGASSVESNKEETKKNNNTPPVMIDLTIDDSDAESEDIPIRPRRKLGNPKYVIDDSSSDSSGSSSTTEGSAETCPASPVAPMSPACITLDSRSPSPEPPPSINPSVTESSNSGTGGGGAFSSIGSQRERDNRPASTSSATGGQVQSQSSSSTSFDYGTSLGQTSGYPPPRSNTSQQSQPVAPIFAPGAGYLPYDGANMWGSSNSGNYQSHPSYPSEFNQLDFQSMDYFNFDARGGNTGGYGRWT